MHEILHLTCLLLTAALFGGMLLFAAALAAFLFAVLPVTEARCVIRLAFPPSICWSWVRPHWLL